MRDLWRGWMGLWTKIFVGGNEFGLPLRGKGREGLLVRNV